MTINFAPAKGLKRINNWRILLYGKPGVGKTSAIRNLPGKTLVVDLDNSSRVLAGEDNIFIVPFDRQHPSQSMEELLRDIPTTIEENHFDTLVIDNVSSLEKDWFVEKGRESKNGISNELQHYSQWTNYFARIMTVIYELPINILVTAWEVNDDVPNESGQTFKKFVPEIRANSRNGLLGLTDMVGRMMINPDTGNRGVILSGNDFVTAKNRLDNRTASSSEDLFKFDV
ncbi:AAA family ATPase [Weissella paramesenteroides]|uniref:Phage nucleotide-binding protein n=1 Tax=Weissella paramesenteroides ATCC 33313 TaxID=585506 RepID=C5R854_WEIPA|nr:AAA family ATPase [Weissella paramesenteroides]EER75638.1 phage nucleotide-binding protein [Weissella paramesenteroides ATCC 33313]